MALKTKVCPRIQTASEEVWRPRKSFVDKSKPMNKVIVSFVKPSGDLRPEELSHSNAVSPTKEVIDIPHFAHAYIPGDVLRHLGTYYSHMTSHMTPLSAYVDDDVLSERSYEENINGYSQGITPRTNILSHMAKNKTSWVENALQNRVQTDRRKSSILIKGSNPNSFETPYEKSQRSRDTNTKGVRNGKRFDLLPISKYLSKFQNQIKMEKEKQLPLVRISSVHRMPSITSQHSQVCHSPIGYPRGRTFFTERDQFKPREIRLLPTRGEATFVDIREQLPSLYKKQYNAPVVKMGREQSQEQSILKMRERVPLPIVVR